MGLVADGFNQIKPKVEPEPDQELDPRTRALKNTVLARLKRFEARLTGRPFDTDSMAELFALCLVAAEDCGGSRGILKEALKPNPKKSGGFDPLWGKSFELVTDRGAEGIKCFRCDRTSYHPEDVRHRYCGYCHEFHDGQ